MIEMIEIKNQNPEDAVFNTLTDMRMDIKQLLMEIPPIHPSHDRVLAVYYNNMAIYNVLEILDKYQMEVI